MTAKKTNNTNAEKELQSEEFELENAVGHNPLVFTGVLLADATSQAINPRTNRGSARWTEMSLYRVTEGDNTGVYVLEVIGMSDVYHLVGVDCPGSKNGNKIQSEGLTTQRPNAVACWECHPPVVGGLMPPMVVVEVDRPQLTVCPTPQAVKDRLTERTFGSLSNPAQNLLTEAAKNDPAIHDFLHQPIRL